MSSYEHNVYYYPETWGLEIIGSLEIEETFEYDTLVVVREKKSGRLYGAADSGCSCSTPFENYDSISQMRRIRGIVDFDRYVVECSSSYYRQWSLADIFDLRRKVLAVL